MIDICMSIGERDSCYLFDIAKMINSHNNYIKPQSKLCNFTKIEFFNFFPSVLVNMVTVEKIIHQYLLDLIETYSVQSNLY